MRDVRDMVERAAWTAAQTALAVMVASGAGWLDVAVVKAAGVAAGAAALSALKTAVMQRRG